MSHNAHLLYVPQRPVSAEAQRVPLLDLPPDVFWDTVEVMSEELERSRDPEVILVARMGDRTACAFTKLRAIPPPMRGFGVVFVSRNEGLASCRARDLIAAIDASADLVPFFKPSHLLVRMVHSSLQWKVRLLDLIRAYQHGKTPLLETRYDLIDWEKK